MFKDLSTIFVPWYLNIWVDMFRDLFHKRLTSRLWRGYLLDMNIRGSTGLSTSDLIEKYLLTNLSHHICLTADKIDDINHKWNEVPRDKIDDINHKWNEVPRKEECSVNHAWPSRMMWNLCSCRASWRQKHIFPTCPCFSSTPIRRRALLLFLSIHSIITSRYLRQWRIPNPPQQGAGGSTPFFLQRMEYLTLYYIPRNMLLQWDCGHSI